MTELAQAHRNLGQWQEAEALDTQATKTYRKTMGPEHFDTLGSMTKMIFDLLLQDRLVDAETELMEMLSARRIFLDRVPCQQESHNASRARSRDNRLDGQSSP